MGWLTGWNYQKQLFLNGTSAGSQTNYQMQITVNYGNGTDSAGNIFCGGNCKADFSDIRFTNTDGTTLLNYWIESYTSSSNATVWVQIPSISTGTNSTYIYIYYGNPSATTTSNGDSTFNIFFDNFPGTTLNATKWTKVDSGSYITINNGLLINNGPGTWGQLGIYSNQNFNRGNVLVQFRYKSDLTTTGYTDTTMLAWKNTTTGVSYTDLTYGVYFTSTSSSSGNIQMYEDGTSRGQVGTFTVRTQYWIRQILKPSGGATTQISTDEINWSTLYDSIYSTASPLKLGFAHYQGGVVHVDNIFIRNYTSPEPTWGSVGTGSLSISSTPSGAEIYINNIDQGVITNTTISNLPTGTTNILLRLSGYADWTGTAIVSSGVTTPVSATLTPTSWLTNWNFRKKIYINGTTAGNQTNYQIKLTVNYGSNPDSAGNIYCGGNVKSDFSDIRFTDTTGNTLLSHWIDNYSLVSGTSCEVWINIPSLPIGQNSVYIYIYYGNPSAVSTSNGSGTFPLLFDDFTGANGSSPDATKWSLTQSGGGITDIQNNTLRTYIPSRQNGYIRPITTFTLPVIVEFRAQWPNWGDDDFLASTTDHQICFGQVGHLTVGDYACCSGDASGWVVWTGYSTNTWYHFRWTINPTTLKTEELIKGNSDTRTITNRNLQLLLGDTSPHATHTTFYDNAWIRSYATPEPTWSSTISAEQSITLNISSNPSGGEIYLAFPAGSAWVDQLIQTPAIIYPSHGTGYYDIAVAKGGYQIWTLYNQYYQAGQTYNISATLIPESGTLSISSTPSGAEIYINGSDTGLTTSPSGTTISEPPGTYNIRLALSGYYDWTTTGVSITSNSTTTVTATFAGSAYITSTPSGSSIYLDGNPTSAGISPLTITNLTLPSSGAIQSHTYILKFTGYVDMSGNFTATAGSTITIPVTFPGSLNITSIPTGAQVYIDGVLQ